MNKLDSTIESIKTITRIRNELIQSVNDSLKNKKCTHIETNIEFNISSVFYDHSMNVFLRVYKNNPNNTAKILLNRVIIHE